MLVRASREEGVLEEDEQEMLHNVFEFADKDAADVMVPRPDVVALDVETPVPEMLQTMLDNPYTRYPVYRGRPGRRARHPPRARPVRRAARQRHRPHRRPRADPPGDRRPRDEAAGRAARRVPVDLEPHGDRGRRVRLGGRPGHAGGRAGGDRGGDRRRVRPARVRRPADRQGSRADRRLVPDRRVQRPLRHRRCPARTTTASAGYVFGELGRAPRVGDSVSARGARFEVSAVDGKRITQVDVDAVCRSSSSRSSRPTRAGRRCGGPSPSRGR